MPTRFDEPDLDQGDGWDEALPIVLPREIDRALAFARFSRRARVILQRVAEACWGAAAADDPPGEVSCLLDVPALAHATGLGRRPLAAARRNLIASKVLIEGEGGRVRINGRTDQWTHPRSGRPRLAPKLLEFCRAGSGEGGADGR